MRDRQTDRQAEDFGAKISYPQIKMRHCETKSIKCSNQCTPKQSHPHLHEIA